ncbi:MAG: NlpC/P60 family protein [Trueperaceae bacterium]|nr:NlpC/P60 family protein [Trueperaceae bacterium]
MSTSPLSLAQLQAELGTLLGTLAPDRRVRLLEPTLTPDTLGGVAEVGLEPPLQQFAARHGLRCTVDFISPLRHFVVTDQSVLRRHPDPNSEAVSDARYGEAVYRYDEQNGFVRVATERDRYLGWLTADALSPGVAVPTHRVNTPRAHVYAEPSVEAPPRFRLSHGVMLQVRSEPGDDWSEVVYGAGQHGFVRRRLLTPRDEPLPLPRAADIVAFAHTLLYTPYLWGRGDAWGLDCSGLVQHVYASFGIALPRDADQQANATEPVARTDMRAADLLFFPGHVAIALDERRFIHANAHRMAVSIDALDAPGYGQRLAAALTQVGRVAAVIDKTEPTSVRHADAAG